MDRRVTYDTAFANALRTGLELRFDQRHQLRLCRGKRERCRQYRREADEARIAGDDVDRLGDVRAGQETCVQPLMHDDARVLAKLPGELAMTDIDGVRPPDAARQQHLGEAAGRGPDIERDVSLDLDREVVKRVDELDAAARHPGMISALERKRGIGRELFTGFVDAPLAKADQAGKDQRLRPFPALR